MKLSQHPKFPKEKEVEEDNIVEQIRGIGTDCAYEKGYNQCLRELGELEILEELDEEKVARILKETRDYWDSFDDVGKVSLLPAGIKLYAQTLCSRFGTKKISVGEIEKIIENWFIKEDERLSNEQIKEVDEKGLWHSDLKSLTFNEIKTELAQIIVEYLNK